MEYSYEIRMIESHYGPQLVTELEGFGRLSHLSLLMQDSEATP